MRLLFGTQLNATAYQEVLNKAITKLLRPKQTRKNCRNSTINAPKYGEKFFKIWTHLFQADDE